MITVLHHDYYWIFTIKIAVSMAMAPVDSMNMSRFYQLLDVLPGGGGLEG